VPALLEKKHRTAVASFIFAPQRSGGVVNIEIADRDEGKVYPQMSVVHRLYLEDWDAGAGAYVLVDPVPTTDGKYHMYVGEATKAGVSGRIKEHSRSTRSGMSGWMFAVAVHGQQQDTKQSRIIYDEAQALEHYLYKELKKSSSVDLQNTAEPSEVPLLEEPRDKLKNFVKHVVELLKAFGCDPQSKPDKALVEKINIWNKDRYCREIEPSNGPKPKSLRQLIKAGVIEVGTKLVSTNKEHPCEARIIDERGSIQVLRYGKDAFGNWEHELSNDPAHRYATLSGATKPLVIWGGRSDTYNGWTFWHLASDPRFSMQYIRDQYNKNIVKEPKVKKKSRPRRSPQISSVKLSDLIQSSYVQIGTKIVSTSKKHPCEARIVDAQGSIQVLRYGKDTFGNWEHELSNDPAHRYSTLSAATNPVVEFGGVKNTAGGWEFWKLADAPGIILKDIREQYEKNKESNYH